MKRYLLNTTTNVICVAGDVAVTDYKKYTFVEVMAEEVEVEGGFAIIGTKENGEIVEAFLSEEAYFEGKEFRVGRKVPRTLIVEGKELEVEARKMEVEEAIKTINAYLEEVGAVINKIEEDELRHELRDIENPLKWYVANLEEMVAKKEELEEIEMVAGTKVKVVAEVGYKGLEGVVVGEAYTSRTDGKKALIVEVEKVGRKYLEVEEVEIVAEEEEEEAFVGKAVKRVILDGIKIAKQVIEGMESGEIEFDHETYNYYKYERIPRLELDLENI